jgi:cysteine desulfurase
MHANNEVGTYAPVRAIADRAHAVGALMHTDAVQSVGALPVQCGDLGVDLLTCSAHKLYGPKGIGILYVRRGTAVAPILYGGGQERGRRPGTENVAAAVGFAHALALSAERRDTEGDRLRRLRDALEERVRSAFPGILINGLRESRLPHILSVSFPSSRWHLEGEMLVPALDLEGIAVSSGSACTSGSIQPSHVLLAMGRDEATARATVRFSFGRGNTEGDVDAAFEALRKVL